MSAASTHFKLGLFTLLAILGVVATAFALGVRSVKSDTVTYHSYFDESVQGLEVGAPVEFRGVTIGAVSDVRVAPDGKLVDVSLAIDRPRADRLKLAAHNPQVRAELGTRGITGVKLVDIDFFDPSTSPPPALPFPPAEHYIPSRESLLAGLLDDLSVLGKRLPALIDATVGALHETEAVLVELHGAHVPDRLAKAVDTIEGAAAQLGHLLGQVDRADIPDKTAAAMNNLGTALARVNGVLDAIGGDAGLVASTRRATDSIGDLGRRTAGSATDLDRTLRDLDEAALAIRQLADAIDREPDMLLKGRAPSRSE